MPPQTTNWVAYAPLVSAAVATVAAMIAVWGVILNGRGKTVDTIGWCMKTYYDLQVQMPGTGPSAITPDAYFERLWGLQLVEFHFFKLKVIPEDLYVLWLWARHQDYHHATRNVGGKTFKDGWRDAKPLISDPAFSEFADLILANQNDQKEQLRKKVRKRFHPWLWWCPCLHFRP